MTALTDRPILALTMGDPVGVGPEIIVKALVDARIYQVCRPLVLGDLSALERARLALAPALTIHLVDRPAAGRYQLGTLDLMPLSGCRPQTLSTAAPPPHPARPWWAISSPPLIWPWRKKWRAGHRPHQQDLHEALGLRLSRPYRAFGREDQDRRVCYDAGRG